MPGCATGANIAIMCRAGAGEPTKPSGRARAGRTWRARPSLPAFLPPSEAVAEGDRGVDREGHVDGVQDPDIGDILNVDLNIPRLLAIEDVSIEEDLARDVEVV